MRKNAVVSIIPGPDAPISVLATPAEYVYYGHFAEIRFKLDNEEQLIGLNDDKVSLYKEVVVDEKKQIFRKELYILTKTAGKGIVVYFSDYRLELDPFELFIDFDAVSARVKVDCNISPKKGGSKCHTFIELNLKLLPDR